MATLVLGVAGSALGAAGAASAATVATASALVGGIGGVIGTFVDKALIFRPPDTHGPRLDSIELQHASEGAPVSICLGPTSRVAGTIVWMGDTREVASSSGKGGPSVINYLYYRDIAVKVCRGQISAIKKIWADGKLLYDDEPDVSVSSDVLTASVYTNTPRIGQPSQVHLDVASPSGGPDLSALQSGVDAVVAGWTAGGNNGSWRVVSSELFSDGTSTVRMVNATAAAEAAGNTITIDQALPSFKASKATSITIYDGSTTQSPDPLIEAAEGGSGEVPAFRGDAYVVFERLSLADYGNRPPQFQFLVEAEASTTVGSAISQICQLAGLAEAEIDVTGVTGALRGYTIRGPQPASQALAPILLAYDARAREAGGKVVFEDRATANAVTVPTSDLGAHEHGSSGPAQISVSESAAVEVPRRVSIKYQDPDSDYQAGSQREIRSDGVSDDQITLDFPMTLTASEARCIARRVLWSAPANSRRVDIQLPPKYLHVLEGDRIEFTLHGKDWKLLAVQVDRGANGLIVVEAVEEDPKALDFASCPTEAPVDPQLSLIQPPNFTIEILDIAPFRDSEAETRGIYYAAAETDPTVPWLGGDLMDSPDDTTFTRVESFRRPVPMGSADTKIGTASQLSWDRNSTVRVTLIEGALASTTELEVLNGANRAVLGNEVIAYTTATLVSGRTYDLSNFLRGLRGTRDIASDATQHTTGERFVALNEFGIGFLPINQAAAGVTRYYKAVPTGGLEANFTSINETPVGHTIRPFPVAGMRSTRDGSNNVTWSWLRTSRAVSRIFGGASVTFFDPELYDVEIRNSSDGLIKTISGQSAPTFTYTAAAQTADGITPGIALQAWVYQVNSSFGRGLSTKLLQS